MVRKIIEKYGKLICMVAVLITTFGLNDCKGSWYQPKEPEGLEEFIKNKRRTINHEKSN